MPPDFRFFFNKNQQFCEVFFWDVHPNTFENWKAGRWAYFVATYENPRKGKFGEIHFVKRRFRHDTVAHELDHLRCEWMFSKWIILTPKIEEWFCTFGDELHRRFWREYGKYQQTNQSNKKRNY
jgi:hypothetical protein